MKHLLASLALMLFTDASQPYFHYERALQPANAGGQHYVVVDETIWQHSRANLDDIRFYVGQREVPYAFVTERGSLEDSQKDVRVLQPAVLGGKTQFFLDMAGVPEYDRIELRFSATNFVANAHVAGQDDMHGARWADLGSTIVYDLSDDHLGGNGALRLPLTTYRYLRVVLDGPVKPTQVSGASAGVREEQKEVWRNVGTLQKQEQQGKDTVVTFAVPEGLAVERASLAVNPAQPNFERSVEIQDGRNEPMAAGSISRIHLVRHGQKIDSERTILGVHATSPGTIKVVIHNGDDSPLKIDSVILQQYERRLYFDASAGPQPTLYYGDEKLTAPIYDYAKLFQQDANARQVQFDAEQANPEYTGRPDDRPWSERHPAVLWVAILAAVIVLGGLALRSMKTGA